MAFIDFASANDAKRALIAKNHAVLGGREIRLKMKQYKDSNDKQSEIQVKRKKRKRKTDDGDV